MWAVHLIAHSQHSSKGALGFGKSLSQTQPPQQWLSAFLVYASDMFFIWVPLLHYFQNPLSHCSMALLPRFFPICFVPSMFILTFLTHDLLCHYAAVIQELCFLCVGASGCQRHSSMFCSRGSSHTKCTRGSCP